MRRVRHNFGRRPKQHKYNAKATVVDGIKFPSKAEARYYSALKLRLKSDVLFFLRQVPVHLPGGTKLVVDFLEFHHDGTCHFVDVKGVVTDVFKIKQREVEAAYPITIETVK